MNLAPIRPPVAPVKPAVFPARARYLLQELQSCCDSAKEELACVAALGPTDAPDAVQKSCLDVAFGLHPKSSPAILAATEVDGLTEEITNIIKGPASPLRAQALDVVGSVYTALWMEIIVSDAMAHRQALFTSQADASPTTTMSSASAPAAVKAEDTAAPAAPTPLTQEPSTTMDGFDLRRPEALFGLLNSMAPGSGCGGTTAVSATPRTTELDASLMMMDESAMKRKAARSRIVALSKVIDPCLPMTELGGAFNAMCVAYRNAVELR